MEKLKIKIKKLHPNAVIPKYSKLGDAGMDLVATEIIFQELKNIDVAPIVTVKFGLSIEIPEKFVGLVFPRSSIYKTNSILSNSVGVIDSGYRGEIMANFIAEEDSFGYKVGDRCVQIIILPYPQIEFEEVDELSITERNTGGFGSTGN
jgi:dUTP pyrophosphatase